MQLAHPTTSSPPTTAPVSIKETSATEFSPRLLQPRPTTAVLLARPLLAAAVAVYTLMGPAIYQLTQASVMVVSWPRTLWLELETSQGFLCQTDRVGSRSMRQSRGGFSRYCGFIHMYRPKLMIASLRKDLDNIRAMFRCCGLYVV